MVDSSPNPGVPEPSAHPARLAEPTDAAADAAQHRAWELFFAVAAAANAVLFVLVTRTAPADHRWLALSLLGAMVVWYVLVGHAVVAGERETWRSWVFQAVLLALFVGSMTAATSSVALLLFALCPLTYMSVRLRLAHLLVAMYACAPAVVSVVRFGPGSLPFTLTLAAISITVSVVIAETTARTERVSRERATLIRELEDSRAEVTRLSREAGIAEERQRLAGDIHDTVAQGLSSVVMLVEAAEAALDRDPAAARDHLRLAARTARENLDETRAIVAAHTPVSLAAAPLADALRRLVDRFGGETGIAATLSAVGDPRPLATGTEVVLLRVVQEALHNVRKHAGASQVCVELVMGAGSVAVRVSDDGVGFDAQPAGTGYGLSGMRARVEQAGGTLTISTAPGHGTTIRTEMPA
jgi:signal transduction histidine kinase